jgi:hypothetical protein
VGMFQADIDRRRAFLLSILQGGKIVLEPRGAAFDVSLSASAQIVVRNLLSLRAGKLHTSTPSAG